MLSYNLTILLDSNKTSGGGGITATSQNSTSKVSFESLIDQDLLKLEIVTLTLALIFAFFGNLIVVLTLVYNRYRKANKKSKFTRMNFFIIHLSLADIYVSLGNILPMLLWRRNNNIFFGGDLLCRLVVYVQVVSVYYSTYVLIMMTIDRYEAICRPLVGLSWSKQRGHIYILIAFICAHLQGVPQIRLFALREIPNVEPVQHTCYARFDPPWLQNAYIVYTFLMQFLLPLAIICVSYATITIKVISGFKSSKSSPSASNQKKSAAAAAAVKQPSSNYSLNESNAISVVHDDDESSTMLSSPVKSMDKIRFNELLTVPSNADHCVASNRNNRLKVINNKTNGLSFRQHCSRSLSKSKIKTIKLTLTVIILYIICSTPYFTGLILNTVLDPSHFHSSFLSELFSISLDILYIISSSSSLFIKSY